MKNFDLSRFGIGTADTAEQKTPKKQKRGYDIGFVIMAVLAAIVVVFFQASPIFSVFLYPFKILVTIVHELSHAFTTIITGGQVKGIEIHPDGSGVTYIIGGFPLLVYSAGYLGSILFGGGLLLLAKQKLSVKRFSLFALATTLVVSLLVWMIKYDQLLAHIGDNLGILVAGLAATGAVVFASLQKGIEKQPRRILQFVAAALFLGTTLWTIDIVDIVLSSYAIGIVLVIAGGLALVAYRGPNLVLTFFFYILAIVSNLYAALDLISVFLGTTSPNGHNDAVFLADKVGGPAIMWATIWLVIGAVSLWQFFRFALRKGPNSPNYGKIGFVVDMVNPFKGRSNNKPKAQTPKPAATNVAIKPATPSPATPERKIRDDDPFGFRS